MVHTGTNNNEGDKMNKEINNIKIQKAVYVACMPVFIFNVGFKTSPLMIYVIKHFKKCKKTTA